MDAPGQVWGKDAKPVHVQAVIAGYGTPAAQRTVSLVVNGKTTATKTVAVPANGRATVDFPRSKCPTASAAAKSRSIPPTASRPTTCAVCRRALRPAKSFADPQLRRQPFAALHRSRALGGRAIGVHFSNRSTSTRRPTASRPTTPSSFSPMSIAAVAAGKFAHAIRALRRQSPHRRGHLRRRPLADSHFRRAHRDQPAITAACPIATWRSAPATPPIPPSPRPTAGRA